MAYTRNLNYVKKIRIDVNKPVMFDRDYAAE